VRQLIEAFKARGDAAAKAHAGRGAWTNSWTGWKQRWDSDLAKTAQRADVPIHPDRIVSELARAAPANAIIVADIGMNHTWIVQQWKVRRSGMLLQSGGLAAMGMGVCGSLGAKLAAPDRPVIAVVGDGGFMMHNNAVATAVEHDLPVVWLVWNNCGYVSIRDLQKGFYGREYATRFRIEKTGELHSADYAMMARAMGAQGIRVEKPGDLGSAIETAIASGKPTVLDVQVEADVSRHTAGVLDFPPLLGANPNYDPDPLK
jgi:acetolactate synthase-1/2/3 large subunit